MGFIRLLAAALTATFLAAPAFAAPLEAYGRLPTIEDAAISPDGASFAMIQTNGEQRHVVIQKVGKPDSLRVYAVGDAKLRSLEWASPKHLLLVKTDTSQVMNLLGPRREWAMAFVFDTETTKMRPLMTKLENAMNVIYGEPMIRTVDGRPMVFLQGVRFVSNRGRLALYQVDLERGSEKLIDGDMEHANDWAVDANGAVIARSEYDPQTGRWTLRTKTETGWKPVTVTQALNERPDLSGLGRDGTSVLVRQREDERTTLREVAKGATSWGEPLETDGVGRILRDPATHTLIGSAGAVGDEDRYRFFNPQDQKVWTAIAKAFPGSGVRLVSWSADRMRVVVRVDSPTEGPAYSLVDLASKKASWIGEEYDGVKAADIAPMKPIRFKAADGLELSGYLILPKGREAKNLPLVVFPHGGPATRDVLGFDWWAQAMASRGYAVLQVNYRGSDGFGWSHLSAGFGQWGRKMQTDLSDGVTYLAKQGTIDPSRVCIVGASYGGYAALAGVTLQKDIYRCAASVGGPSDLAKMVGWSRRQGGITAQRYWLRFMGAENTRDEVLDEISPAMLAAQASVPVLLVHGKDDTVVPLEQSRFMADALKKAGRKPELVVLEGDDHWLSRGATRLQMLRSVVAFLEKHNPPS